MLDDQWDHTLTQNVYLTGNPTSTDSSNKCSIMYTNRYIQTLPHYNQCIAQIQELQWYWTPHSLVVCTIYQQFVSDSTHLHLIFNSSSGASIYLPAIIYTLPPKPLFTSFFYFLRLFDISTGFFVRQNDVPHVTARERSLKKILLSKYGIILDWTNIHFNIKKNSA